MGRPAMRTLDEAAYWMENRAERDGTAMTPERMALLLLHAQAMFVSLYHYPLFDSGMLYVPAPSPQPPVAFTDCSPSLSCALGMETLEGWRPPPAIGTPMTAEEESVLEIVYEALEQYSTDELHESIDDIMTEKGIQRRCFVSDSLLIECCF